MTINFKSIVPADSFIGRYMAACEAMETSRSYDFFGALWCLSTAIGRECLIDRPRAPVYLNLYCMFIAESGVTRKSTAVRFAAKTVKRWMQIDDHNFTVVEGKTSSAALEWELHQQTLLVDRSDCAIVVSELVTLLGKGGSTGMVGLLTDLYDCAAIRRSPGSIARGQTVLRNVYPNILTASTPVWLLRSVNQEAVEGGFTSRCFFVADERPKARIPWPSGDDDRSVHDDLGQELHRIHAKCATIRNIGANDGAHRTFAKWYTSRVESRDPFLASFASREDAHVLKIAALLAINDGCYQIQQSHILTAIKVVNDVKHRGATVFGGVQRISPTLLAIDRLRARLIEAGLSGLSQTDCIKIVERWLKAGDLKTLLAIMHELNMVQRFEPTALGGRGRPKIIWRATVALQGQGVVEELWRRMEPT